MSLSILKFHEDSFLQTDDIAEIMRLLHSLKQNKNYCSYAEEYWDIES